MTSAPASDGTGFVRRAALAAGILVALTLLVVFYSTVAGAVSRAESARRSAQAEPVPAAQRPAQRAATPRATASTRDVMPRAVSYVRRSP